MVVFRIKENQKYFRPFRVPWPVFKPKGFTLEFKIERGAWASKEEWGGDEDWHDWMKLGGLTSFFYKNNFNALLAAFRYGEDPETYEVTGYTNWPKKKFNFGKTDAEISIIEAGKWHRVEVEILDNNAAYRLPNSKTVSLPFEKLKFTRKVNPYPGGGNNSAGEFGGRAFKDMKIKIDFKTNK